MTSRPRRDLLFVLPLLHVAVWSLFALFAWPVGDYGVETDFFGDYVPWSREWMAGHATEMNGFKGPGYYLLLGGVTRAVTALTPGIAYPPPPGWEYAIGKLLSVLSAGAVLYFLGGVVARLARAALRDAPAEARDDSAGEDPALLPALLAQLIVALSGWFLDYTYRAGTDLPALAFSSAALFVAVRSAEGEGDRARNRGALLAGMLAGLAYLVRYPLGIVILAVVAAFGRRGWKRGALAFLALAAVLTPWAALLAARVGDPLFNRNATNLAFEIYCPYSLPLLEWTRGRLPFDSFLDIVRADPGRFFGSVASNVGKHLRLDGLRVLGPLPALLVLAGWGLGIARTRTRGAWGAALTLLLGTFLVSLPSLYDERFTLPMLLAYALGIAGLAPLLARGLQRAKLAPGRFAPLLAVLALGIGYGVYLGVTRGPERIARPVELEALRHEIARRHVTLDPAGRLAARKSHASYWLGVPGANLPNGPTWGAVVDTLRSNGVRYLAVGSDIFYQREVLSPLLDRSRAASPGLSLLAAVPDPEGGSLLQAALYEIEGGTWRSRPLTPVGPVLTKTPPGLERTAYVRWSLGRFLLQRGFVREAAAPLASAAARQPRWVSALVWDGDRACLASELEPAEARYREALALRPNDPSILARSACVQLLRGNRDAAFDLLHQALRQVGSDEPATLRRLAREFEQRGELVAAFAPYELLAASDSTDWMSRRQLGLLAWTLRRDAAAAHGYFSEALALCASERDRQGLQYLLSITEPSGAAGSSPPARGDGGVETTP
ncbi:MAG: glycosyltransferase family 39 protein [Candidatus Eisenbacteria bacterium]